MRVTLNYKKDGEIKRYSVSNMFTMDERLDEELDGGACVVVTVKEDEVANFSLMTISMEDEDTVRYIPFFAFSDIEKRAPQYYKHAVELIEPTRWLMGLTIDGLKVTQPITGTKKTLYDVLVRVLKCFNTQRRKRFAGVYEEVGTQLFKIDEQTKEMLKRVTSPEFEWNAGTLLFEVLQDMADVVNCIPRVTASGVATDDDLLVTFDKVNDVTAEFEV